MNRPAPIDFDQNATAPLHPAARTAILDALAAGLGNPSSAHGKGQTARSWVDRARSQLAGAIGADPIEIIWTSGATEANVLAGRGVLGDEALRHPGPQRVVATALEHASVLALARQLREEGVDVSEVAVDSQGLLDLAAWADALRAPGARLASALAVGNELGTLNPLAELAQTVHAAGARLHSDITQAIGRVPVDVRAWGLDLASLSGHKFGAPSGVGALWLRRGGSLRPLHPGHQEQGLRAGTENILGIVALGAAAAAVPERLAAAREVRRLRDRLWQGIQARIAGVQRNGDVPAQAEVGNVLNLSFAGVTGPTLMMALDLEGVAISAGSACNSGAVTPSHVLQALARADAGTDAAAWYARGQGAVRFSLGPTSTELEVDRVLDLLPKLVARIRGEAT